MRLSVPWDLGYYSSEVPTPGFSRVTHGPLENSKDNRSGSIACLVAGSRKVNRGVSWKLLGLTRST